MGMGMDEADVQPRPPQPAPTHQHQQQPQGGRHPHPLQRREAAAGGSGGPHATTSHGLSLSLPLHLAAGGGSSAKVGGAGQPPANGDARQQQQQGQGQGHGHGRDDCWSEGATNTLIEAWGDRYLELNRGNLKQKHWKDVADAVTRRGAGDKPPKTDVQCKNRLDTLKKKYKLEKGKIFGGGGSGASKWPFFAKLDELIGPSRKHQNGSLHPHPAGANKALPAPPTLQQQHAKEIRTPDQQFRIMNQHPHQHHQANNNNENNNSGSSRSDETPDTTDSCPNGLDAKAFKKRKVPPCSSSDDLAGPLRELTRAIIKFGEVYERVEVSKQQQLVELEKQRMEFIKEMEMHRMQLFAQSQVEVAKINSAKHGNTEHYL